MIAGIVLAGGASRRMGRAKALLPTDVPGETFAGRIAATFRTAGVDDLVVVTRPELPLDAAFGSLDPPPRVVANPDPERGQLSSLLAGLALVDRPGVDAVMVTTVDQPLVAVSTVARLLEAYRHADAPVVRPARGGRHGHPVIFARSTFDELRRADPARGAKAVVRSHGPAVLDVMVDDEGAFVDVDTPDDYRALFGRAPSQDDAAL